MWFYKQIYNFWNSIKTDIIKTNTKYHTHTYNHESASYGFLFVSMYLFLFFFISSPETFCLNVKGHNSRNYQSKFWCRLQGLNTSLSACEVETIGKSYEEDCPTNIVTTPGRYSVYPMKTTNAILRKQHLLNSPYRCTLPFVVTLCHTVFS